MDNPTNIELQKTVLSDIDGVLLKHLGSLDKIMNKQGQLHVM